jgi:putative transcriptional regulator
MKAKKRHEFRSAFKLFNRIEVLRVERRLSRQELADAIGVNYQTIGYLERGEYNPSLEIVVRLMEFFKLPLNAIFSREAFKPLSEEVYGSLTKDDAVRRGEKRGSNRSS